MKTIFGNLVLAAIVLAVIAFFAAPAVAFFAIRSAAEAGDVQGLARLIDFTAVRQSIRPQLQGRPEALAPPPAFLEDPIGALRRQFEDNPIIRPPSVDVYLTPAALAALTRGEGRAADRWSSSTPPPVADKIRKPWPRPAYWGFNRARMSVADASGARTVFTFERRGPFDWRLVQIGLPPAASTAPAARLPPSAG